MRSSVRHPRSTRSPRRRLQNFARYFFAKFCDFEEIFDDFDAIVTFQDEFCKTSHKQEIAENEKLAREYEEKRKKVAEEGSNNKMYGFFTLDALSKKLPALRETYEKLEAKLQKAIAYVF